MRKTNNQSVCGWLLSDDCELPVSIHLDDAAGLMLFATLSAILDYIVNSILDFLADFFKCLWSGLATDVGYRLRLSRWVPNPSLCRR